jgi:dTDP-4-amino-4,6-dideoxygalactose transaminase
MVPYLDLKAQYRGIASEIDAAVRRVLENCSFILGPEVADFEAAFARYCTARHAVGMNSGTSAIHLALLAAGIGPGDEVITAPFTFVATVAAIEYAGARPVLADIGADDFCLDPDGIEAAITPRTKAIMPVHLFGQCADMDRVGAVARRHGLLVIEDAAQAHGAEYRGRRAGTLGEMGVFSFYPGKNLGAAGEGGALVTDHPDFAARARVLRDWGAEKKYQHVYKGYNYRMEGLQGAILGVKLRHLEAWTEARRRNAARYAELLEGLPVRLPRELPGRRHVWHVYSIRTPRRDELQASLTARGIATGIHYPTPVHLQPAYADLGYKAGDFPVAEAASREVLALPIYPELTDDQLREVADGIRSFFAP